MLYYSIFIRNNVGERKERKVGREKEGIVKDFFSFALKFWLIKANLRSSAEQTPLSKILDPPLFII